MSQRQRILRISAGFFPTMWGRDVRGYYEVCENGLPPDTRAVSAQMSPGFRDVLILLESDEFAPVPEGEQIPEIMPMFRQYNPPMVSPAQPSPN